MKLIQAPSLAIAHERIIKYIVEEGDYILSEDKEHTIETDSITTFIDTPFRQDRISKYAPQQEMAVKEYTRQLIEGSKNSFDYTYHGQLFEWNIGYIHGKKVIHNQMKYIVDKLIESPVSRRAIAIVFDPMKHQYTDKSVPCLQLLQFVYRDGRLNMKAIFRSNDMLTAAGSNMYALTALQKKIADELEMNSGSYTHIALVPHIYHVRDSKELMAMIDGINRPKIPDNKEDKIKIQSWILDNIEKFAKKGEI